MVTLKIGSQTYIGVDVNDAINKANNAGHKDLVLVTKGTNIPNSVTIPGVVATIEST